MIFDEVEVQLNRSSIITDTETEQKGESHGN